MAGKKVKVNRAPVLTLWAAIVAERLGYSHEEALTLGRGVAGLNAQSKGRRLGIYEPNPEEEKKRQEKEEKEKEAGKLKFVEIMNRSVPVVETPQGERAVSDNRPMQPQSVERYLEGKFKEDLPEVRSSLEKLAQSYSPQELEKKAYSLYEKFRPEVPEGTRGWGAQGELDLGKVESLGKSG